jgi:hypothetical protein
MTIEIDESGAKKTTHRRWTGQCVTVGECDGDGGVSAMWNNPDGTWTTKSLPRTKSYAFVYADNGWVCDVVPSVEPSKS